MKTEPKQRKPGSGGARPGTGKKAPNGIKKPRSVVLTDTQYDYIKSTYGGLAGALRALLPDGLR